MKHKLLTTTTTDVLYLPDLLINQNRALNESKMFTDSQGTGGTHTTSIKNIFLLAADSTTEDKLSPHTFGILRGANPTTHGSYIHIDQGVNNADLSPAMGVADRWPELYASTVSIRMPHHLIRLVDTNGTALTHNFVDDDQISLYHITDTGGGVVSLNSCYEDGSTTGGSTTDCYYQQVFDGPRGSSIRFKLRATQDVQSSTYFFERYGGEMSGLLDRNSNSMTLYYIDINIAIRDLAAGGSIDVPVRLVKFKS